MLQPVICLASASPRRRALLEQIGIAHRVAPSDIDESALEGESAESYVQRLAGAKASAVARDPARSGALPVLGADTTVIVDGVVLGKPRDAADAARMLAALSGRAHRVLSAIALVRPGSPSMLRRLSVSQVLFRELTRAEIDAYWASGEPRDKAGAYAIQGLGARFVRRIEGSFSGVMGLPLFETAELLTEAGIAVGGAASTAACASGAASTRGAAGQP
jgi:septum formation protein